MNKIFHKKKGPKVSYIHRTKRAITVRNHGFTYYAFVFIIPIMIIFNYTSAFSLDFITREDFAADEASYKDYPLRLLFKKLADSDPSEKAVIRNYIILKQVFDQNTIKMDKTGIIKFDESYGIIKEITEDNLKLWIPETNNYRNYFLGLERIPTEKAGKYRVTESNITDYACVIYSLDERIYKIKIDFKIAPPDQLNVERDGSSNIVSWNEPSDDIKPYMYKLFRNGELFETVEENSAKVPREKGIIDNYFVKSVYKHGQGILESEASEVLYDEITAKERQNELIASEFYTKIESALMEKEYGTAKSILYDEKDLLYTYLDDEKKEEAKSLIAFFTDIDEGDRIIAEKPDDLNTLETAIKTYEKAKLSAELLPENLNTDLLAQSKIEKSLEKKRLLEDRNNEILADEIYISIVAAINSGEFNKARNSVSENKSFLDQFLDKEKKDNIAVIDDFFTTIDEGDKIIAENPDSVDSIVSAIAVYEQAGEKAAALPESINVSALAEAKIDSSYDRKRIVETKNKEILANNIYDDIITEINSGEFNKARNSVSENKSFLDQSLDKEKKDNIAVIDDFFTTIDRGDKIIAENPDSVDSIVSAIAVYEQAGEKAAVLPESINVAALAEAKIDSSYDRKRIVETKNKEILANNIYDDIITEINPEGYEKARKNLYDNSSFLDEFLNQSKKTNIVILMDIFHEIDEGDKLGLEEPETTQRLGMALSHYQTAGQTATQLPPGIDINSIIQLKIKAGEDRLSMLERQNKELIAQETYNEIIESMKPLEWENGEKVLKDNIESLSQYLPQDKKEVIDSLIAFFNELEKGDMLRREMPETKEKLDQALALYSDAGDIADGFSHIVNVRFISDQKIRDGLERKSHLEMINKRNLAREKYEEIIASMNREHWEEGKNLLIENRQFMKEYLDDYLKENTERLVEFFQDIEEGDRFSETVPETVEALENAFSSYKRAEQKASDLPKEIDILFLTRERLDECRNKINRIEEESSKREVLAAASEKEAVIQKEEEDSGVKILTTTITPVDESDRESILKSAMEKFDKNDYTASWNDFLRVYRKQINDILRGGQNRIKGVLGLPARYRAEIFFLIELEDLKNKNEGEGITEEGLEEISDRVENGEGMWTIIRDTGKIRKIKRHIARFDLDKSE